MRESDRLEELERRLGEVEHENRRLTEAIQRFIGPKGNGPIVNGHATVMDRREAIKSLGKAAAAGVGIAAASTLLRPGVAGAAHGGANVTNADADTAQHVENTGAGRAILADNSAVLPTIDANNAFNSSDLGAATLRLRPSPGGLPPDRGLGGELMVTNDGIPSFPYNNLNFLHYGTEKDPQVNWGRVLTDNNFNTTDVQLFGTPTRAVDTRDSSKRPGLPGGTAELADGDYTLDLSGTLGTGAVGFVGTLTAVHDANVGAAGYLTVWETGNWPETSNLNFPPNSPGIATLAMTGVTGARECMLRVYAGGEGVHVIVDIIAAMYVVP